MIQDICIEYNTTVNKVHDYITRIKWKDYAPTTREMQEIYDLHFKNKLWS
jgi:hypothetical protein